MSSLFARDNIRCEVMYFGLCLALGWSGGLGGDLQVVRGVAVSVPAARRTAVHLDPVEALLVRGKWRAPVAGVDKWVAVEANKEGWFEEGAFRSGYGYFTVESPTERVMLLEAKGHSMAYVNGVPHAGDPYEFGYVSLPIKLRAGTNDLLFQCGRWRLSVRLVEPKKLVSLDLRDSTLPDKVSGKKGIGWAAFVVRNATEKPLRNLEIQSVTEGGKTLTTKLPEVAGLGVRKVGFRLDLGGKAKTSVRLLQGGRELDSAELNLRIRKQGETFKQTFVSEIDGSVQYFSVNPSTTKGSNQALFLSLHGASVESINQADAYSPKNWGFVVAPTNRRPFGFDWEDVGRLDALEVLGIAKKEFQTDPTKTYLTGHSMGGHGTWNVGSLFPDKFAAIAPSAGWISFYSYAGGARYPNPSGVEKMLLRASATSDTLLQKQNYAQEGIFILHGDADDNVPVTEARTMREELSKFHHDFDWHEEKGANHWWDASPEPGADAVDYAPIFDMFSRHRLRNSSEVHHVDFTTSNPGASASCHWVTVEQQDAALVPSRVDLQADPLLHRFSGSTSNVKRMTLSTAPFIGEKSLLVEIDGTVLKDIPSPKDGRLSLEKRDGKWLATTPVLSAQKNPLRYGLFKDIYKNRVMFVYGTTGTPEENRWSEAKARFDAEMFWYRGNSSVDVVSDKEFGAIRDKDRNVVLYGNSETNGAWGGLLKDSPVQITRSQVSVEGRLLKGEELGCFFIRPRSDSRIASVAVVAGTGLVGSRMTERAPLFSAGAGFPDLLVLTPQCLEEGTKGIAVAGFFGMDWSVGSGEFAWKD